jgi:hypothetical protein
VSSRTLADAMANAIIRERAEDVMVKATDENDPVYLLAWLVREQAKIVEAVGGEVAMLRLGAGGLTLRDQFAIHAPPMPNDWRPRVKGDPKPERPTLDFLSISGHARTMWRSFEQGKLADAVYTAADPIGDEWRRARTEILAWDKAMKAWKANREALRAARWPWHYADLCLLDRDGE